MKNIGIIIAQKLADSGHTRTELADHLEVSKATISYWINGRKLPSYENLRRIAAFVGCSAGELLGDRAREYEGVSNERLLNVIDNLVATHERVLKRGPNQGSLLTSIEGIIKRFQEVEAESNKGLGPQPKLK
jgi:transcriptional regulator with XRE-family HTH domain